MKWKCSASFYRAPYSLRHVHCVHVENQFLFLLMGKRCWNLAETIRRKMNHIKWFLRSLLHTVGGVSFFGAFFSLDFRYVWKRTMKHMPLHEQNTFLQTPVIKQIRHTIASERKHIHALTHETKRNETNWNWTKENIFISLHRIMRCIWPTRSRHNGR